jgi:hypothetical protein
MYMCVYIHTYIHTYMYMYVRKGSFSEVAVESFFLGHMCLVITFAFVNYYAPNVT